jgi:hypothetical protein
MSDEEIVDKEDSVEENAVESDKELDADKSNAKSKKSVTFGIAFPIVAY